MANTRDHLLQNIPRGDVSNPAATLFDHVIREVEVRVKKLEDLLDAQMQMLKSLGPGEDFMAKSAGSAAVIDVVFELLERTFKRDEGKGEEE